MNLRVELSRNGTVYVIERPFLPFLCICMYMCILYTYTSMYVSSQHFHVFAQDFNVSSQHFNYTTSTLFFERDNVFFLLCLHVFQGRWSCATLRRTETHWVICMFVCLCVCAEREHQSLSRRKLYCALP